MVRFRRRSRLGSPTTWTDTDKCLLAAVICGSSALLVALTANFASGWPYLSADLSASTGREIARGAWYPVLVWALWTGALIGLRRRVSSSPALIHITVQAYAVSTALFTYLTGPLAASGWLTFLGGAIVGLLLFERAPILLGVLTWAVAITIIALLAEAGYTPFPRFPVDSIRVAVVALTVVALILPLCSSIIASLREREAELQERSRRDALTGIANRRHLLREATRELSRARRYEQPLSCIMIDIDHFKRVNDEHGHLVGDRVLVTAAHAIQDGLRDVDLVGRFGGEEFVVLLPNTDATAAHEVAERCRARIAEREVDGVAITASLGVAGYPHRDIHELDDLLRMADEAMYRAKATGRDRVAS